MPNLTEDSWYNAELTALLDLQPGAIICSRTTPGPIGFLEGFTSVKIQSEYQLLFRKTYAQGGPTAQTGP